METDQPAPIDVKNVEMPSAVVSTPNVPAKPKQAQNILIPEVDLYIHLLVLLFAIDQNKFKQVNRIIFFFRMNMKRSMIFMNFKAEELIAKMMDKITSQNRRSMDALAAKCYFYYVRVYELLGKLDQTRQYVTLMVHALFFLQCQILFCCLLCEDSCTPVCVLPCCATITKAHLC